MDKVGEAMEERYFVMDSFAKIDPHGFVLIDPKIVARIEHIEAMLEASEKEKRAEARVRVLEEALWGLVNVLIGRSEPLHPISWSSPLAKAIIALEGGTPDAK